MFERFTERARQAIVLAQEEARILKHDYINTEHILLGLLREEEGLAARVLESLDITVERVRMQVVRIVGLGEEVACDHPFTPRAKKVFELALREALSLGHNYIGTEHLLLGLVREAEGVAARILLDFDPDSEKVRNEVIRILSGPGGGQRDRDPWEPWVDRSALSEALFDGSAPLLPRLGREVEGGLGRSVDAGDLLLLLAVVPEGLAARALAALGVDVEAIVRAVAEARRADVRSSLRPPAELLAEADKVRLEKEAAIHRQDFEEAAKLRDRERRLRNEARSVVIPQQEAVLRELRTWLGLGDTGEPT
jgi:ATP-dependent Clp protease ATP-binding subunit ClpA